MTHDNETVNRLPTVGHNSSNDVVGQGVENNLISKLLFERETLKVFLVDPRTKDRHAAIVQAIMEHSDPITFVAVMATDGLIEQLRTTRDSLNTSLRELKRWGYVKYTRESEKGTREYALSALRVAHVAAARDAIEAYFARGKRKVVDGEAKQRLSEMTQFRKRNDVVSESEQRSFVLHEQEKIAPYKEHAPAPDSLEKKLLSKDNNSADALSPDGCKAPFGYDIDGNPVTAEVIENATCISWRLAGSRENLGSISQSIAKSLHSKWAALERGDFGRRIWPEIKPWVFAHVSALVQAEPSCTTSRAISSLKYALTSVGADGKTSAQRWRESGKADPFATTAQSKSDRIIAQALKYLED